jgi:hypothetical protein
MPEPKKKVRPYRSKISYSLRYRQTIIGKGLVVRNASVSRKCDGDKHGHHAAGCTRTIKTGEKYLFNKRDSSSMREYYHCMPCAREFVIDKKASSAVSVSLYEYPNV